METANRIDRPSPCHRPLAAILAVALIVSVLGLAGAATAGHYAGTKYVEVAMRDYEAPSSFGLFAVATHNEDQVGITGDASIDTGGVVFPACQPDDATSGEFDYGLRCNETDDIDGDGVKEPLPDGPYDLAEITVNDQLSANVAFTAATCSDDGDFYCGETDNTRGGAGSPGSAGPDELAVTYCTPDWATLERDPNDPSDGTGDGVWNQTGEFYDADGDGRADYEHPGVLGLSVFLWDPIAETVWFTFDPCNGISQEPTTGTITITGT